ncbi:MAG: hypothetical protein ACLU6Y_02595 [Ruminococcus sp.]
MDETFYGIGSRIKTNTVRGYVDGFVERANQDFIGSVRHVHEEEIFQHFCGLILIF